MIQDLIERLEKATGRDRQIDFAIAGAVGLNPFERRTWDQGTFREMGYTDKLGVRHSIPDYTSSIDAALTLVPEGCACAVVRYDGGRGTGKVYSSTDMADGRPNYANGANPALALCIAALRARAGKEG